MTMSRHRPVLILYNVPPGNTTRNGAAESDAAVLHEVSAVKHVLEKAGIPHRPVGIGRLADLQPVLSAAVHEYIAINLVEDLAGEMEDYNYVPALCRTFGKSATGSDTPCLLLTFDKWRTKAVLKASHIPVPEGLVVPPGKPLPSILFPGPYMVKPVARDASEGIEEPCVFASIGPDLQDRVRQLHRTYNQPVLLEQFVGMREFNVSLRETENGVEVLPLAEIDFTGFPPDRNRIVSYPAKWRRGSFEYKHTRRVIPARLDNVTADQIRLLGLSAWDITGCRDYARVDFRMDNDGNLFVLEINANPDISPDAGFAAALKAADIDYCAFVKTLIANAWKRLDTKALHGKRKIGDDPRLLKFGIRRTRMDDREAILDIIEKLDFLRSGEIGIAREVLDDALLKGSETRNQSYVSVSDGKPIGWICFGPTPRAVATFDIYWIAVARDEQGKGVGKALMLHAEKLISEMGGRLCVVETSGRAIYDSTREFYRRLGFSDAAHLPDFYTAGDDKVIYTKRLSAKE